MYKAPLEEQKFLGFFLKLLSTVHVSGYKWDLAWLMKKDHILVYSSD